MTYFGNSGGNRSPIRIVVALIIVVIGLISYFSHTQTNPVTGEKQHISLSPTDEIRMGLSAAPAMAGQMRTREASPNDPQTARVISVGQRVVQNNEIAKSPFAGHFQFHLLDDPRTVNAFALPGGQIFITRGLLDKLTTEGQLATVLGHEAGHVIERHAAEQMAKSQLGQALATGAYVASDRDSYAAAAAASFANQMILLKFSRDDESQSDEWGAKLSAAAGYDPYAILEVMEILQREDRNGRTPEFLQNHPTEATRIDRLKRFLAKNWPR